MQQQPQGGSIVMISSVSGHRPSPGTAAYGAAKAGLDSLVSSLAIEWAPKVRVNSVIVGMVGTESSHLHYGDDAGIAAVEATVPLGRLATPRTSAGSRSSCPPRWPATSTADRSSCTGVGNVPPSWTRRPSTTRNRPRDNSRHLATGPRFATKTLTAPRK